MVKQDIFPDDVQLEVEGISYASDLFSQREAVVGVTVDGPTSKDLDDAIYVKKTDNGYSVQVSIADVAALVEPNSPIYNEALERVETQYRKEYNIPMLPRKLSEDLLSLREKQRRPTITFFIDVSDDLYIEKVDIRETVLESKRRLTYLEVDRIIEGKKTDPDYDMFVACNNLANRLLEQRRNLGALVIYDMKRKLFTNEEGQLLPLDKERANKGNLIIQELMVLTNQAVAKLFAEENIPFLFRNHTIKRNTPTREDIVQQFNNAIINPYLVEKLSERTSLWFNRATYDPVLQGHFGLNEAAYSHITSPIRRAADLINHHIIKAYANNHTSPFSQDDLVEISAQLNNRITEIRDEKTEYFKSKATDKAQFQAINSSIEGLVAMEANEFRLVLKQVCRSGIIGDDFENALKTRFEQNKVDVSHLYTVFFDMVGTGGVWDRFREWALTFSQTNPGYSNQLLNLQTQKGNLSHYEMEVKQAPEGFIARVVAATNAGVFSTQYYSYGQSKKDAQHKASYNFLMGYLNHTLVSPTQTKEPEEFAYPSLKEEIVTSDTSDNENHVGQLNELCASRSGWSMPRYVFRQAGPSHQPIITCECILETGLEPVKSVGTGTSKKIAKQSAAQDMANIILREGVEVIPKPGATRSSAQEENYVGRLNELCQRNNWELPTYQFEQTGPSHNPDFTCTVTIKPEDGPQNFVGKGSSKKVAKQTAAHDCLVAFSPEFQVDKEDKEDKE